MDMRDSDRFEDDAYEQDGGSDYHVYYFCANCGQLEPIANRFLRERLRTAGGDVEIICLHCNGTMEVQ